MTNSLVQVLCNATLQQYGGDLYVGVISRVINSIREVITMPITGLTNGSQPVLGYNYGAREYGSVRRDIRFSVQVTMAYSVVIWLVTLAIPELLIRLSTRIRPSSPPVFRPFGFTTQPLRSCHSR